EESPERYGLGECGPLPGLSIDAGPGFEEKLKTVIDAINHSDLSEENSQEQLFALVPVEYPSILFGLETAFLDLSNGGERVIYRNRFIEGDAIPINGLIWMGDM